MKKNLKITNNLKLCLGVTQGWKNQNLDYLQPSKSQISLKIFQSVHRLFLFSGRSLNFLFRYYYFSFLFRRGYKRKELFKNKLKINFFFFFKGLVRKREPPYFNFCLKQPLRMRKKFFLSTLLNFFSSINCVFFCTLLLKNFYYFDVLVNLCFFSKRLLSVSSPSKEKLKRLFAFFLRKKKQKAPLDLIGRPVNIGEMADTVLVISKRSKLLKQRVFQYFLFVSFKYFVEKKFLVFCKLPVYFNIRIMPFFLTSRVFNALNSKVYRKHRLKRFSNHYRIKTLHKIQSDLISSVMCAYLTANAQLLAEQFAIGINRTRKQKQFVYWFVSVLNYYSVLGTSVESLKLILFGKLGGKMRTQHTRFNIGKYTIKNQTYALKVSYGFSSAETYSGTFGVHLWLYQTDSIAMIKFYTKYLYRL